MDDSRTDEALMLAYREGDIAAFEALYGRWRGRLYRYLAHQAPRVADELLQDLWLRVVRARAGYEVAQFYFTALPDSYAVRTDRPDHVGVIGVAVFREKERP